MGSITVLGAPVAMRYEVLACLGEISRRAKAAFAVHRRMMTGPGSNKQKLVAYGRFITPAALWAVTPARPYSRGPEAGDRTNESWAEWNQRSLRLTRTILAQKRHHSQDGLAPARAMARRPDDRAALLGWRDQAWWEEQQADPRGPRHLKRFNAMLNTDRLLNQLTKPWQLTAQNRIEWSRLEAVFIKRFDVPWSSGKQDSLENLAPN